MTMEQEKIKNLIEEGRPLERISALEAGQERLSRDVVHLGQTIESQGAENREALRKLTDRLSASQKTQWPTIIAALTFVTLVVGSILNGYIRDLGRIENSQDHTSNSLLKHMNEPAHVATAVRIEYINKDIEELKEELLELRNAK